MPRLIFEIVLFLYAIIGVLYFFRSMLKRDRYGISGLDFMNHLAHKQDEIRILGIERLVVSFSILALFVISCVGWPVIMIHYNRRKKK